MEDSKRQPEPSSETSPTVFARPNRQGGPRSDRAPPQFAPGAMLGKYRIVKHLGAGGMGAVYEAVHTEIGKEVALKVLSRELATDPRAQARFLREALAASRLDHPHVVNVTDYASQGDVAYLVMELLRGEDLGAHLDRHPNGLFVEEAVDILLAVCAGVFAAHQLGVVHRDIKPRNIFLARNHMREIEPTVLDFGISKVDDGPVDEAQALTDSGVIVGTVQYVSPEHVRGAPTDARSDQYALGVVLYECLTGRLPHQGKTSYALLQTIAEGRFPPPSAIRGGIPPALEKQLLRAMSTEPNQRFDSVHTFGRALLEFASAKRRVMWAEYFGRPDALVSVSGPPTRTSPIAVPMAPARPTTDRGKPPAARTPQAGSARVAPPGETVYREPPALARPGKGRGRWMVWGLLLLAGGGATWAAVRDEHVLEWANGGRSEPPAATPRKETSSPQAVGGPAVPESPPAVPVSPPPAQGKGSAAEPTASANADDNTTAEERPASPPQTTGTGAAATTPPRAADPAPQTVSVQVSSTPSGAAVFLDDAEVSAGKTPVVLTLPRDEQPRVIWVRLPRHRPASRAAVLNEDQSIHLQLQRLSARPRNARAAESAEEAPEEAPIERHYQKLED